MQSCPIKIAYYTNPSKKSNPQFNLTNTKELKKLTIGKSPLKNNNQKSKEPNSIPTYKQATKHQLPNLKLVSNPKLPKSKQIKQITHKLTTQTYKSKSSKDYTQPNHPQINQNTKFPPTHINTKPTVNAN